MTILETASNMEYTICWYLQLQKATGNITDFVAVWSPYEHHLPLDLPTSCNGADVMVLV